MRRDEGILARFGKRVRELGTAHGVSQEAFAHSCHLDRTYISGIKRGKRNVSLRNLELIANALGLSVSELLSGI